MKTIKKYILFLIALNTFIVTAQKKKTIASLEKIKDNYTFVDNRVKYQKIYENPENSKAELYALALDFLKNYTDAKIEIISKNETDGKIRALGIHENLHSGIGLGVKTKISATYTISIHFKDGKSRIIITPISYFKDKDAKAINGLLTEVSKQVGDEKATEIAKQAEGKSDSIIAKDKTIKVVSVYPFNTEKSQKNFWGKNFYKLNNHITELLLAYKNYMSEHSNSNW